MLYTSLINNRSALKRSQQFACYYSVPFSVWVGTLATTIISLLNQQLLQIAVKFFTCSTESRSPTIFHTGRSLIDPIQREASSPLSGFTSSMDALNGPRAVPQRASPGFTFIWSLPLKHCHSTALPPHYVSILYLLNLLDDLFLCAVLSLSLWRWLVAVFYRLKPSNVACYFELVFGRDIDIKYRLHLKH